MRCLKFLSNRKAIFAIAFIYGIVIAVGLSASIMMMIYSYRYRINIHIIETYKWEYISDALPTLLSSTYNGRTVSELFGEYLAVGGATTDNDVKNVPTILKTKLDLLLGENDCYKLSSGNFELKSKNWDSDFCKQGTSVMSTAKIVLPYSQESVGEVTLLSKTQSMPVVSENVPSGGGIR